MDMFKNDYLHNCETEPVDSHESVTPKVTDLAHLAIPPCRTKTGRKTFRNLMNFFELQFLDSQNKDRANSLLQDGIKRRK